MLAWRLLVVTIGALQLAVTTPASGQPAPSARIQITAKDDRASDSSFADFRTRLLAAARKGDREALITMISPTVNADFATSTPKLVLDRFEVREGHPWRALVNAIELGVARLDTPDDEFAAPYPYALFLDMDDAAIVGRNVHLRAEPRADARVLKTLSMEVVSPDRTHRVDQELFYRSDNPQGPAAWARVTSHDGHTGYVYGRFIWSPDSLRFIFGKVDGAWKLTALAEGD